MLVYLLLRCHDFLLVQRRKMRAREELMLVSGVLAELIGEG